MYPINGLRLGGEAPPGIHHEHGTRIREIQANASGSQRDEEDAEVSCGPKLVEDACPRALGKGTIESKEPDARAFELGFDEVQEGSKLGEDNGLCGRRTGAEGAESSKEGRHFGRSLQGRLEAL